MRLTTKLGHCMTLEHSYEMAAANRAIRHILPHSRGPLRSTGMQRVLSCESDHTSELIRSGAWEQVGERPAKTGPNSFYRVARESVIRFLRQRALNH